MVVIPTYNTGPLLARTEKSVLERGWHVIVVVDGSTDGSGALLETLACPQLSVFHHERNRGKGAAVLTGVQAALDRGASHAVLFDADGQHPPDHIAEYVRVSRERPAAMVCGVPKFGQEAPWERRLFRKIANGGMMLVSRGRGPSDPLFGMRVMPCAPLLAAMKGTAFGRRYDFEAESALRLCRAGHPVINLPTPVCYVSAADGGVSHYHYLRDNVRLILLFFRHLLWLPFWAAGRHPAADG